MRRYNYNNNYNNDNGRMTECHEACDDSGFIPTKEYDRREPNENWLLLVNDNENDNDNYDGKAV